MNIGKSDKIIRLVAGLALLVASFAVLGGADTTLGIVVGIVGVVLLATAIINFCPIYKLLGLNTGGKAT